MFRNLLVRVVLFAALHSYWAAVASASETQPSTAPSNTSAQTLHAGPITLKFKAGELRYLRVGDREIVRRIYFGVREAKFAATDMPSFTESRVEAAEDHFAIHLAAACRGKTVSYDWTADITGSADGKIEYHVTGSSPSDGTSARIGLCVLYGADSLTGQKFEALGEQQQISPGQFPELVSPSLVASQFHTLRYTLDAMHVSCGIAESPFDMEDQRNWGDSSFKAYDPMPYAYPKIEKGKALTQTLVLCVDGAAPPATAPSDAAVHVSIGLPIPGARVTALNAPDRFAEATAFTNINGHRDHFSDATAVSWKWTTATHLPDDDTSTENLTAVASQARTVRSFAPRALLRVGPVSLNGGWPSIVRPPALAAAWTAGAIKSLSLGNVDEAAFGDSTPGASRIIALFKALSGKPLVAVVVKPASDIDAFAVNDIGSTTLWIVNRSDQPRSVTLDNLPPGAAVRIGRPAASDASELLSGSRVELSPYDVCRIVIPR